MRLFYGWNARRPEGNRCPMRKYIVAGALAIGLLVWLTPWAFYWGCLRNVDGRPVAPVVARVSREDELLLRDEMRVDSALFVRPLSPWSVILSFASEDPNAALKFAW